MYCVIQKIKYKSKEEFKNKNRLETELKKSNRFRGYSKELVVTSTTFTINGITKTKYHYDYSPEHYERDRLDAYKVSIHHSFRENGKVKKKQWAVCTIGYYDFIDYDSYDFLHIDSLVATINEDGFDISEDELYDVIYEKLNQIEDAIKEEYYQTEEYITYRKIRSQIAEYSSNKQKFKNKYGVDEYDCIYDVFGNLRNEEYLNKVKSDYEFKQEYQRKSYEYQRQSYSNYSGGSSYFSNSISNYNDDEKKMLHEIYRMASKKFHPDVCGDDGGKMKFLTKLKEQWGL